MEIENKYQKKYLKYKTKYENLKHEGGAMAAVTNAALNLMTPSYYCRLKNAKYDLDKNMVQTAEDFTFIKYNNILKLDTLSREARKNKEITADNIRKEHETKFNELLLTLLKNKSQERNVKQEFLNSNSWMNESKIVGFRLRENSNNINKFFHIDENYQPTEPIFYSPKNQFFWQFEPVYNLEKREWFNVTPAIDEKNQLKISTLMNPYTQMTSSVYLFNWEPGFDNVVLEVENTTSSALNTIGNATSSAANTIGQSLQYATSNVFHKSGGVRLDNLLPDPNLVNPPQIGGSEKI